jgi:head-tail adaptor
MAWLAPKLRERVQIRKAIQTPNATTGGFDRSYELLDTVWAAIKPMEYKNSNLRYIRNVQTSDDITHEFQIRWEALRAISIQFSSGFNISFDSIVDIISLKSDYFIFMKQDVDSGLDWDGPFTKGFNYGFDVYYGLEEAKGRLFRIMGAGRADERKEYIKIVATELEEMGTGLST